MSGVRTVFVMAVVPALMLVGCRPSPLREVGPVAPRERVVVELHGRTLVDDYGWLSDVDDPRTRAQLEAENRFAASQTAHLQPLRDRLYAELLARVVEDDDSLPVRKGSYLYWTRTRKGLDYPIHLRRPLAGGPEQVLLDVNELARGKAYCNVAAVDVSDCGSKILYLVDYTGGLDYELHAIDLSTRTPLFDPIEQVADATWLADNQSVVYLGMDDSKRPFAVWRRNADGSVDTLYREPNREFYLSLYRTRTGDFVVISGGNYDSSEVRVLDATRPDASPVLIEPARPGVEYYVDHQRTVEGGRWLIRTNDQGPNFRLVWAPQSDAGRDNWVELIAHREEVMLDGVSAFSGFFAIQTRENATPRVHVILDDGTTHSPSFPEPSYFASIGDNEEFETTTLRLSYQSLVSPSRKYELDVGSGRLTLLRESPAPGYDRSLYESRLLWVRARDGVRVPVSLVRRRDLPPGPGPLLLYGYGAYGLPEWPWFDTGRVSLLDRGVTFAIAHVRGGGELGQPWTDAGRLAQKFNSFNDFIDVADQLVEIGLAERSRLVVQGGSAGGLLVAAALNQRPDLAAAAVLDVPFVDVLNTMLDDSLPLTTLEYTQWGNPNQREWFEIIRAYCPYQNLRAADYPAMLVTTSLNDSQVLFHEPAKYVAKLRSLKTDTRPLLFKIDMTSGHAGASGRYDALREEAFRLSFVLWMMRLE